MSLITELILQSFLGKMHCYCFFLAFFSSVKINEGQNLKNRNLNMGSHVCSSVPQIGLIFKDIVTLFNKEQQIPLKLINILNILCRFSGLND